MGRKRNKKMKIKIGPKTITINSIRFPKYIPGLRLIGPFRVPTPWKAFTIGGSRAAFGMLAFVAVGFGLTIFITHATTTTEIVWPKPGAAYALPNTVGQALEPDIETPLEPSQTLKINLADGIRLSTLKLEGLSLGKTSLSECMTIERADGTSGTLSVDSWTMTGVSAPSFDMANVNASVLTLGPYVDGGTVEATVASVSDLNIISTRGAGTFEAKDITVDRVVIVLLGSASIGTLTMSDISCHTGSWNIQYVNAGSIVMDNTSKFGDGDGIDSADFVVNSTVKASHITSTIVETPITVQ